MMAVSILLAMTLLLGLIVTLDDDDPELTGDEPPEEPEEPRSL